MAHILHILVVRVKGYYETNDFEHDKRSYTSDMYCVTNFIINYHIIYIDLAL